VDTRLDSPELPGARAREAAETTAAPTPATTATTPAPAEEVATPDPQPDPAPAGTTAEKKDRSRPKATASSGKSAAALYEEGADLFVKGKAAEAKDRFKEALAIDPRHAPSYRGLGLAYQALGRKDKAIDAFERYLQLSPGAADADSIRARIEKLRQ
jgi:tetratricopeptide (TPR) repeat protein